MEACLVIVFCAGLGEVRIPGSLPAEACLGDRLQARL